MMRHMVVWWAWWGEKTRLRKKFLWTATLVQERLKHNSQIHNFLAFYHWHFHHCVIIRSPWEDCKDDERDDEECRRDEEANEVEVVQAGVVGHVLLVHAAGQEQMKNSLFIMFLSHSTLCSCSTSCLSLREPTLTFIWVIAGWYLTTNKLNVLTHFMRIFNNSSGRLMICSVINSDYDGALYYTSP